MRKSTMVMVMIGATGLIVCGCLRHATTPPAATRDIDNGHYQKLAKSIEYPDYHATDDDPLATTAPPISLASEDTSEYLDMSLEEAMIYAVANSNMLRDLGGTVLRTPDIARSKKDASIVETDPRFGIEGALSAFDANFKSTFSYEKNNRAFNNIFFGGGTRIFDQNFWTLQNQISKTSATGTEFAFRNYTQYDANNAPGNEFPGAYTTWFDMEARQPLLRGAGTQFNRLAGPNSQPGVINGVMIARINSDMSLAEFELGVRNFVSDVENAYWDLYYAYRDVDAKVSARNAALETWRRIHALYERGRRGGEAEREAQAREQYYRFEEEAQNSLHGKLIDGTRTSNGSTGGTFRGMGGIYVVERRLRLLMGMPINDGRLIRPSDEPVNVKVEYNWEATLVEGLTRRPELRRQKWLIKKREAELEASKNFLKPQLDLTGRYRFRGFGQDLFPGGGTGEFNNAVDNLLQGNFQEWQAGFEFSLPIGFRQAYAAIRHAELQLLRDRALLREQERSVVFDLSNAIAETERAFKLVETNLNRRMAAAEQLAAVQTAFDNDNASLDSVLDAQRRLTEAEVAYFRARVEYQLSVKNVQLERGTLLEYNEIYLNEGAWPDKAYDDAEVRESLRGRAHQYRTIKKFNPWVSQETYPRVIVPSSAIPTIQSSVKDAPSQPDELETESKDKKDNPVRQVSEEDTEQFTE
jgi:outer membrane protein TolC